jgi:hypothetical protein
LATFAIRCERSAARLGRPRFDAARGHASVFADFIDGLAAGRTPENHRHEQYTEPCDFRRGSNLIAGEISGGPRKKLVVSVIPKICCPAFVCRQTQPALYNSKPNTMR